MANLILIGGGGHCLSVLDSVLALGTWNVVGIADPDLEPGISFLGVPVLGDDDILTSVFADGTRNAAVTVGSIGNPGTRERLASRARAIGYTLPSIVDSTATVGAAVEIAEGAWVGKRAVLNCGAHVAACAIVNTGAIVEHGASVGGFSHISVGAVLCGDAQTGYGSHIGPGATVLQGVSIGDHAFVAAGAVVLSDVPNRTRVAGVPAKKMSGGER